MAEMHKAIEDAIWQSRTGSTEVSAQMQWWFSDRIEQRRMLLGRATNDQPLDDSEVDQIGAAFNNQSGTLPPVQSPLIAGQPLNALPLSRPSISKSNPPPYMPTAMFNIQQRKSNRRTVIAIAVLGTIIGVLAAVLVTGGGGDDPTPTTADNFLNGSNETKPVDSKPPVQEKTPDTKPVVTPIKPEVETLSGDENAPRGETGSAGLPAREVEPPAPPPVKPPTPPPVKPDKPDKPPKPPVDRKSLDELYTAGTQLYLKGDFPGAEAAFKQALAQDRGHAPSHKGLGFLYQRINQTSKALAEYRVYLRLAPNAKDAAAVRKRIQELEQ
jgi:hypothetical protein